MELMTSNVSGPLHSRANRRHAPLVRCSKVFV
jgi:hypothetical protein